MPRDEEVLVEDDNLSTDEGIRKPSAASCEWFNSAIPEQAVAEVGAAQGVPESTCCVVSWICALLLYLHQ